MGHKRDGLSWLKRQGWGDFPCLEACKKKVKVIQAHVAKESKSEGSTDRKEFSMSKAKEFLCFGVVLRK